MAGILELVRSIQSWVEEHPGLTWGIAIASLAIFVGTLIVVPWLLTRIPSDYFLHPPRELKVGWIGEHPGLQFAAKVAKNVVGAVLLVAGLVMLVFPGQGVLTMLVGLALLDVPGKRKLEVALLRQEHVLRAVNWFRRRKNRRPLQLPAKSQADDRATT